MALTPEQVDGLARIGVSENVLNEGGEMSEYTPTPDEVRDRYADNRVGVGEWTRFDESVKLAVEEAYAEYDRMIAEVGRAAAEKAWDEGFDLATRNNPNKPHPMRTHNPYRRGGSDE